MPKPPLQGERASDYFERIKAEEVANAANAAAEAIAAEQREAMEKRRLVNMQRLKDLQSGAYTTRMNELRLLIAQENALARAEKEVSRQMELQARYGRTVGSMVHGYEKWGSTGAVRAISAAGNAGMAGAVGLATKGFSGSVELNRLNTEFTLVGRELAGALLPAIELVTTALQSTRYMLESFDTNGQNAVAGLMGLWMAAKGYGMYQRLGGIGGAVAGFSGSAATGASAAGTVMAAGSPTIIGGGGITKGGIVRGLGYAALASSAYKEGTAPDGESYYSLARKAGASKVGAFLVGLSDSFGETLGVVGAEKKAELRSMKVRDTYGDSPSSHRLPTPGDAGLDEVGGSYERIGQRLAMEYAQEKKDEATINLTKVMERVAIGLERETLMTSDGRPYDIVEELRKRGGK